MSEEVTERSLQDIIQAAITAEDAGVPVAWKQICLNTYQVAMAEIQRLQPEEEQTEE